MINPNPKVNLKTKDELKHHTKVFGFSTSRASRLCKQDIDPLYITEDLFNQLPHYMQNEIEFNDENEG